MSEKRNIRIKDIAKLADVSVGTVDRVLHNRGKVSEDARKKIQEVLENTGYKPNLIARTLGSNKALKIAVLIPNPIEDEYWEIAQSGILQSVEEWTQYGVEISSYFFDLYNTSSFKKSAQTALESNPDGIITAPIFYRESLDFFEELKERNIPYILFNTSTPEANPICFIGQDLYQSGKVGGELLSLSESPQKTIIVLHIYEEIENSIHLKAKEKGVRDFFKGQDYHIESHDLSNPNDTSFEDQLNTITNNPDIKGIFISTSKGSHIVGTVLKKYGKEHLKLVGYDLLEKNLAHLKTGTINFLINQNPKRMTQAGVSHLINHLLFQKELPDKELFPLEVITPQNVDSYLTSRIH